MKSTLTLEFRDADELVAVAHALQTVTTAPAETEPSITFGSFPSSILKPQPKAEAPASKPAAKAKMRPAAPAKAAERPAEAPLDAVKQAAAEVVASAPASKPAEAPQTQANAVPFDAAKEIPAKEPAPASKPVTRDEVLALARKLAARGFDVQSVIMRHGPTGLRSIPDDDLAATKKDLEALK